MHLITDDFNLKDILHMIDDDVTVLVSGDSYTAYEFAVKVVENVQHENARKRTTILILCLNYHNVIIIIVVLRITVIIEYC